MAILRYTEGTGSNTTPAIFPTSNTLKNLIMEIANEAKKLREIIYKDITQSTNSPMNKIYEMLKQHLIQTLDKKEFSDIYAQTITYGMLVERFHHRQGSFDGSIFKSVFLETNIIGSIFTEQITSEIREIVNRIEELVSQIAFEKSSKADFIFNFYELFLKYYNSHEKRLKGVYYTPLPVIEYIVNSVDEILKREFNYVEGFANESVTVLDPAAGTMSFLIKIIEKAIQNYKELGKKNIKELIEDRLLKNLSAFEIMPVPYIIGYLRILLFLQEQGYKITDKEKFKIFLTNTLELNENLLKEKTLFSDLLIQEDIEAMKVKTDETFVIIGNPPYSSKPVYTPFIDKLMLDYKDALEEKNTGNLSNSYIRFIRFAHWKIDRQEKGIIAMIVNNSFLYGKTHRIMRKKIMSSFNKIYILNLHGNRRLLEKTFGNKKDRNIFDIKQGVAIFFFVKDTSQERQFFYKDLYGTEKEKYNFLSENNIYTTNWISITPQAPYYYFYPQLNTNTAHQQKYFKFIKIEDIFKINNTAIVTGNDNKFISLDINSLVEKNKTTPNNPNIQYIVFEPFDRRYIFYDIKGKKKNRIMAPVIKIFKHLLGITEDKQIPKQLIEPDNLVLCAPKQIYKNKFTSAFVTKYLTLKKIFHNNALATYCFPLYLITNNTIIDKNEKLSNIKDTIFGKLGKIYGNKVLSDEILAYIYAILYSRTYRKKYFQYLRSDFPHIPFTKDYELFKAIASLGWELISLHLLDNVKPIIKISGGSNIIEEVKYQSGVIYINEGQYFYKEAGGIAQEVWEYEIGGNQVCRRWLVNRKGYQLTKEDTETYCKILTAVEETIKIQNKIDEKYDEVEKDTIEFY